MRRAAGAGALAPALLTAALLLAGCRDEPRRPAPRVTAAPSAPAPRSAADARVAEWDSSAGPFMVLSTDDEGGARVVRPEDVDGYFGGAARDTADAGPATASGATSAAASGAALDLFGRGGSFGRGTLAPPSGDSAAAACTAFAPAGVTGGRVGWRVALVHGHAAPIALDSLGVMSPADSASLTDAVRTMLAGMPVARDSVFMGVPFVLAQGYRFVANGVETVVANARRSIPSEANGREQVAFIVGERPAGSNEAYRPAFLRVSSGGGDTPAPVTDVLAAVLLQPAGRPALVVSREGETGGTVGFIERVSPGLWRARWTSAYVGC